MSEHDIEELRRQLTAAESRRDAATTAARDAARRLDGAVIARKFAELEASGLPVGRAVVVVHTRYGKSEPMFLRDVETTYGYRPRLIFSKIKKDGTPSQIRARVFDEIERLELIRLLDEAAE